MDTRADVTFFMCPLLMLQESRQNPYFHLIALSKDLNDLGRECTILSIAGSASNATPSTTSITNSAFTSSVLLTFNDGVERIFVAVVKDLFEGFSGDGAAHAVSNDDQAGIGEFLDSVLDHV